MSTFVLTPTAEADLDEIGRYVAAQSDLETAFRVLADLRRACRKVAEMPGIGHHRLDLLDNRYRFKVVHSYVIAYRWETSPIQVIAIVHGARDLQVFLPERGEQALD